MRRLVLVALLVAVAISSSACAASSPAASQPAASQPQCEWSGVSRIVAVGDIHGDFGQFVKVLRQAGLIDEQENWIGGRTHLVQTGDVFDRGPDSRKAMDLLLKLEPQAAAAGGAVHPLIGNHELMISLGDLRYMTEAEKESYGGVEGLAKLMSADGKYGRWIRSHNAVIRINDVLFCHAGLTAEVAIRFKSLADINDAVRADLAAGKSDGFAMSDDSPLWTRELAVAARRDPSADPTIVLLPLERFGAARMVVGHTVTGEGVMVGLRDHLLMIDVGMSACYGGPAAGLLIEGGKFYEIEAGRKDNRLLFAVEAPAASQPTTEKQAA